jgi:hypothetical protein
LKLPLAVVEGVAQPLEALNNTPGAPTIEVVNTER